MRRAVIFMRASSSSFFRLFGLLAAMVFAPTRVVGSSQDPARTVTIYVHGFELTGADRDGVFGDDIQDAVADSVAALIGLPTGAVNGSLPPNAVVGTTYYGDTAPGYYSATDLSDVDAITAQWGGGVPRYALILAKFARHALERSGAQQVNFVSVSFGALVTRWLIEKDLEGLASQGKIARWLTLEGVVSGNWVASHDDLVNILALVQPEPIDVHHMKYDWVETNLASPRTDTSNPLLAGILLGHVVSTDDSGNGGSLRDAMLAYGEYAPNDGVQAAPDAVFRAVGTAAQFQGRGPTVATFYADHLGLANHRSAWAEAATFLTGARRVTVTMTSARVVNLHEPSAPWWDWRPAEVLFESRVFSPAAAARWGITEALSSHVKDGAAAPLVRFSTSGETKSLSYVLFDDFVLPQETALRLELHDWELDYDLRYGVTETIQAPYYDDMGGGTVIVSTLAPGTYSFANADWSCSIDVKVYDYPFLGAVGVSDPVSAPRPLALAISPQPSSAGVRIAAAIGSVSAPATLEILDLAGRLVRHQESAGADFSWDGRDTDGNRAPAGIYLARVRAIGRQLRGRICRIR